MENSGMTRTSRKTKRLEYPLPFSSESGVSARALESLPDLAPPNTELPEAVHKVVENTDSKPSLEQVFRFTKASVNEESTNFRDREEARDPIAFLTVYAITGMVMLFAFPLGFALMVFNILGGENLRTSAHVMGLTGLASALPLLGFNVPFLT